jgi:3-methyladenine DNA glycosylase AlkC
MTEKFSLKDHLFNELKVKGLAGEIYAAYPEFEFENFIKEVVSAFPNLELKERISWISSCLKLYLPDNYVDAVKIIIKALPQPLNTELKDNDFGDFIYAPYSEFIATYGCTEEHLFFSLDAIKEITKRFSAEYAIRKFINSFPNQTLEIIVEWSKDSNYHVRRLASEGTRQKLPWGQKIHIDPKATISILDNLYTDSTRFVTRSVANHLNDLSKSHPEFIISTLEKWLASGKQSENEMLFIVKHTLRNLIKDGHPKALNMLGVSDAFGVVIQNLQYTPQVVIGSFFQFSFEVHSKMSKRIVIDYIIYFQNKLGQMNSKKIHKLQTLEIEETKTIELTKKHPLRANMTTRKLYPGTHKVEIQVNGLILSSFYIELIEN